MTQVGNRAAEGYVCGRTPLEKVPPGHAVQPISRSMNIVDLADKGCRDRVEVIENIGDDRISGFDDARQLSPIHPHQLGCVLEHYVEESGILGHGHCGQLSGLCRHHQVMPPQKDGGRSVLLLTHGDIDQFGECVQQQVASITQVIRLVAHGEHCSDVGVEGGQLLNDVIHISHGLVDKQIETAPCRNKLLGVGIQGGGQARTPLIDIGSKGCALRVHAQVAPGGPELVHDRRQTPL